MPTVGTIRTKLAIHAVLTILTIHAIRAMLALLTECTILTIDIHFGSLLFRQPVLPTKSVQSMQS